MTREEAIKWLGHINTREFGWDDYAMQDSQKEIRERCEQSIREAIDMAISALSVGRVVEKYQTYDGEEYITVDEKEYLPIVRCKNCEYCKDYGRHRALECTNLSIDMDIHPMDFCSRAKMKGGAE